MNIQLKLVQQAGNLNQTSQQNSINLITCLEKNIISLVIQIPKDIQNLVQLQKVKRIVWEIGYQSKSKPLQQPQAELYLMIQLQNYINSSANLQSRDLSKLRKNFLFLPSRKFIKSVSQSKPRYESEDKLKNQCEAINRSRSRYQKLMKLIREPIKLQLKHPRISPQKQRVQVANFIKFKSHWKPRLESQLSIQRYGLGKSQTQEEMQERNQISKTMVPSKITEYNQSQCLRKYSIKTQTQEPQSTIVYTKPKTTILKRILDAKHLNYVRQIVESRAQNENQTAQNKNQTSFQLKCSYEALERLKKEYEFKPIKRQKNKNKLGKLSKAAGSHKNSGQNIAGWTIKQFAD